METQIVPVETRSITMAGDLVGLTARYQALVDATKQVLREDTDFGIIPGTSTKVLLKPGAEKLSTLFGLHPRFTLEDKMEDWDKGRFYYRYRCTLFDGTGMIVADSEGSCNSLEKKYRWRDRKRKCPQCGNETIIKGRQEYGGGWLCWQKRGGCGAKFQDGDQAIEGQQTGQIENPEPFDLVNTLQKMAQKRALVAAVLVATGASEFFTQDIEDWVGDDRVIDNKPKRKAAKPKSTNGSRPLSPGKLKSFLISKAESKPETHQTAVATPGQKGLVAGKLAECFAPADDADQKRHSVLLWLWGSDSTKDLTTAAAGATLDWLLDKDADEGTYDLHPAAPQEAQAVLKVALKEAGQQELEL